MIKIAHVVHSLEVGGLENGLVNLINRLPAEHFSHSIICLIRSGALAERITQRNVTIHELNLEPDRFKFPLVPLVRLFRRMRPDIVHTRAWGTVDAIMAARVAGISRVVHGEHGRHASDPDGTNLKRRILRKCFSPLVDRFVTVSEDLRLWLTKSVGIAAGKVVRIHNGVDTKRFSPSHRKQARQMMGIDSSTLVIGSVGRLDPVKDHYSLLSAFASIKQIRPSDQLLIVGDGPTRRQIEAQIVELGLGDRVRLFGERRDVADVLRACDIFALTSIAEGISNTILEAMATGLPLVATRVGGNPELIQHGVNGQLAAVGDVQGISAALESYIVNIDLRHSHGRNARRIAEETFSLERMASQYAQLYHELAGSKQEQAA